jgi:orotate phosphoribosyltransferase
MEWRSEMSREIDIAKALLDIKAVSLQPNNPFTWTSGIKSPIYCDNRLTMSYPKVRKQIAKSLAEMIKEHYQEVEVIAGTATAGIPHAAWVAEEMDLPMVYIRSSAKKHGKGKQIEGTFQAGAKVVVIEDLISTGGSVIEAVTACEKEDAEVLGVAAIFTYGLPSGIENFSMHRVAVHTLTNYDELVKAALEIGAIEETDIDTLNEWKKDPENWKK